MNGRVLASILGTLLAVAACSGSPTPSAPVDQPLLAPSRSSSFSGRIAFDNREDVWTINADGTDLMQLTDSPGFDFDPSWSPDGTRIAFRSERSGDTEIWLMNADGSGQHRLAMGLSPAWSPDGWMIAYASPGTINCPPGRGLECTGLSIMKADGSDQHRVPNADGGEYPSWSPDGTRIAFNANFTGDHVMYTIRPDGSDLVDLSTVGEGWQVDWAPDGRSILFSSGRENAPGYDDVYSMRPDGSDVRRLTEGHGFAPSWSPDGEHVAFSSIGLYVMDPDGSGVTVLPTNVGETSLPDWVD